LGFFHGTGVWTQGLRLARQALYHSNHSASPHIVILDQKEKHPVFHH
jgi:hypothetical protein